MGTIDPIQYVQESVGTHKEDVIAGQVFHFSVPLQNNKLRQYGDAFQDDGKGPQKLDKVEAPRAGTYEVNQEGHGGTRCHSELIVQKGVLCFIVRGFDGFLELYRVNNRPRGQNVQHFHHGIVYRIKLGEQV